MLNLVSSYAVVYSVFFKHILIQKLQLVLSIFSSTSVLSLIILFKVFSNCEYNILLVSKQNTLSQVGCDDRNWMNLAEDRDHDRLSKGSTAVGQVVACTPVMQRARVRSPVGKNFLGEVLFGVFPHL